MSRKNLRSFVRIRVFLTLFLLIGIVLGPLAFLGPSVEISSSGLISITTQSPVLADGEEWLDGWAYRKSKNITDNDDVTNYQLVGLNLHKGAGEDSANDFYFGIPDFGEETGSWTVGGLIYTTRLLFTIDNTKVDSTLTNFPVLVKLTTENFPFSLANSDGFDLRFTQNDGSTLLKYERERHDSTSGKAEYWVKIPEVSSSVDTTFYLYFRITDTADGEDATNVWDGYFTAVYHLNQIESVLTIINKQVSQSTDDAKIAHGGAGVIYLAQDTVTAGWVLFSSLSSMDSGIRFQGITIPQYATVTSAYIELYAESESATTTSTRMYAEKNVTPATFSTLSLIHI